MATESFRMWDRIDEMVARLLKQARPGYPQPVPCSSASDWARRHETTLLLLAAAVCAAAIGYLIGAGT